MFYAHNVVYDSIIKFVPLLYYTRTCCCRRRRGLPCISLFDVMFYFYFYFHSSSVSEAGDAAKAEGQTLPQYQVNKSFADRRYKVQSARTYFYLNEATCERNTEIFIRCLESVAGNIIQYILH